MERPRAHATSTSDPPRTWRAAVEIHRHRRDVAELFAAAPADKRAAATAAAREALAPYAGADGVVTPDNAEWLVTARR